MTSHPSDLTKLRVEPLRTAVEIYLAHAYPSGTPPDSVRRRLDWPEGVDAESLLTHPPFERANRPGEGVPAIFALRLGNASYPHMKFQVQPWDSADGYLLSVNTHDQALALGTTAKPEEVEAYRKLQQENARIKEAIETEWHERGLPTFAGYLRSYIQMASPPSDLA